MAMFSDSDLVSTRSNLGNKVQYVRPSSIEVESNDVINKNYLKTKILYVKYGTC